MNVLMRILMCLALGWAIPAAGALVPRPRTGWKPLSMAGEGGSVLKGRVARLVAHLVRGRRAARFGRELAVDLPVLVRSARSGSVPLEIVRVGAREAEGILVRRVFTSVFDRFGVGMGLEDALWIAYERFPHPLFHRFISAMQLGRQSGSDLAYSLSALAEVVRSRELLLSQVREESAEARYSAILVAALPAFIAVYTLVMRPEMLSPLLETSVGRVALVYAAFSWTAGLIYMRWVLTSIRGGWD